MKHIIDAENKKLGRVASEAAIILMGKHSPTYRRDQEGTDTVEIKNAAKLSIDLRKMNQKEYQNFSGYPSGLKIISMPKMIEKKGYSELLKMAIYGMVPGNKLRAKTMKRLTVGE
jgi:large subunit ribosomal protein L13